MELNIDIKKEQDVAQEHIKEQGLRVLVCGGTGCVANGSEKVMAKFRELGVNVGTLSNHEKMTVIPTGCHGFCEQGVLVILPEEHTAYIKVKEEDVKNKWLELFDCFGEIFNQINSIYHSN